MLSLIIIGNLGKDAEVKEINGQKCISFSVAHTHSYNNAQGQKVQSTTWVKVDYWLQKDALSKWLTKGTMVYVEGIPRVYAYQNDQRQILGSLQMRANKVELLRGSKKSDEHTVTKDENAALDAAANGEIPSFTPAADDLPF